ncbi:tetratricopeptide repeat protein [Xanthomonadaceae bacterium JHOS43]|nr:tetratricopeptide repeat protein [Xanthomonadaceae bacterium JHOS43]MCX7563491.1 tetratricopeptide repeat protein [Xanthomonadaceae bacterium XH05]
MDEHEQGELVRSWLRQNGGAIFGGIAIGLAGILGWQWWQNSAAQHRLDASSTYQALESAVERKDTAGIDQLAGELADKFSDTPYGALGLLRLADQKLASGDADAAQGALVDAAKAAQTPALASLANLRLARLQLAAGKAQDALDSLAKVPAGDFAGLAAEVRGDALLALGRKDEAEVAYLDALTTLDTGAPNRLIVEMKLADLGVVAAEPGV